MCWHYRLFLRLGVYIGNWLVTKTPWELSPDPINETAAWTSSNWSIRARLTKCRTIDQWGGVVAADSSIGEIDQWGCNRTGNIKFCKVPHESVPINRSSWQNWWLAQTVLYTCQATVTRINKMRVSASREVWSFHRRKRSYDVAWSSGPK
jgi:hypothetical protein